MAAVADRQVAIVTGAARGIGRACAVALANEGFRVVVADIDYEAGTAAAAALAGDGHEFVALDIGDVEAITATVDELHRRHGRIDVLVNNAGVTRAIGMLDLTKDDWDRISQINARGTFFMMQSVAARMIRGDRIVNVASIAGKGWKETSNIAYASSKGAVIAMTRIAASQLGSAGIRVNAVCPGITTTELMLGWLNGRSEQETVEADVLLAEIAQQVPLGLLNEPADVANAVVFLATDASRTITGQSINVDGGIIFD